MGRAPCCDKMGVKKGPWSPEEDRKLMDYVQKHGFGNWRAIPRQAGLLRCGKSCRLRWTNYLRPDLKRGSLSPEEEQTIIRLHGIVGNRWSTIASYLPGRTDNEIKNIWNTHLKKRLTQTGTAAVNPVSTHPSSSCTVPTTPVAVNNCLSTPCSTVPTTPMAVNNCLSNSLAVQNMCYFPGSPNSECSFSSSKDSAPQFTAEQIELHGAEYDQNLLQTCSVHCHETDEMRSAHDYINSLKTFLDIAEESTPQEIHGVEYNDLAGVLDHITEDYDAGTLDYFNTELFFSHSTFSGNQLDHEILEPCLADQSQEYSSSSDSLDVLSPEILLELPENPVDVPGVVIPPLWMD